MSAPRQKKRVLPAIAMAFAVLFVGEPSWSSLSGPVVTNPLTGLAIGGFDPVAYFTGEGPVQGSEQFEYKAGGVTWRFHSEGNRAAFVDYPEVYAPQFGGYDPIAIARGVSVPGHPLTWAVVGERLYLFYDAKARASFIEAPRRAMEAAKRRWPALAQTLP